MATNRITLLEGENGKQREVVTMRLWRLKDEMCAGLLKKNEQQTFANLPVNDRECGITLDTCNVWHRLAKRISVCEPGHINGAQ